MSNKIWQEFYCNDCLGYFQVRLNIGINQAVVVCCPNCGRKHPRQIKDGKIIDGGMGDDKNEIIPPKSAYSKEPFNKKSRQNQRDGKVISEQKDINERHPFAQALLDERWAEIFGGKK